MSVFGFGSSSSYDPSYSSGQSASTIAQTVPGYQGTPQPSGPSPSPGGVNWNMAASNPLADWGNYRSSWDINRHGGVRQLVDTANGETNSPHANYSRLAYNNPLNGLFGDNGMANLSDNQAAGNYVRPTWERTHVGQGNDSINTQSIQAYTQNDPFKNQFGTDASDPNSFQGLYSRMNGLSDQQLQSISNNIGSVGGADSYRAGGSGAVGSGVFGAFQQAQQNTVNNYANGAYKSSDPMSQGDSLNWLQASYNTLTNRLNQNGLL